MSLLSWIRQLKSISADLEAAKQENIQAARGNEEQVERLEVEREKTVRENDELRRLMREMTRQLNRGR